MQAIAAPLQSFLSKENANVFFFSAAVFSFHVFENEFPCTCAPQVTYCMVYMVLPFFIVTFLMLSTDLPFQRAWKFMMPTCSCHFRGLLFRRTVRAVCVGLLWPVSVLIDSEWYVCCCNPNSKSVQELQCKSKVDVTSEKESVITIAEMKMDSRLYGIAVLFLITFVSTVLLQSWKGFADKCCSKCCGKDVQVYELILEVGDDVVTKKQKEDLSEKIIEGIKQGKWGNSFNVVEGFIKDLKEEKDNPESSSQQQQG
ncbi:uncharacterized protein LOC113146034 isoform X2 [Mastacembelus armatus]|uniref:uncharacterized protein LOC113146034 isoform X2 n=1 Tax=Mastacembelus armatus TaxID=205130 RepID=UPI000E45E6A9|nr:uncharacterized protein LOC113146034 isoform X2 [Mastacembelus armatus]